MSENAPQPRRPTGQWGWIIGSSLFVLIAFGAPFFIEQAEKHLPDVLPPAESEAPASPPKVEEGGHYYVLLAVVEVAPKPEDASGWDSFGRAPDVRYEIHWQGTRVFESSTKDDTLLAKWSNTSVELADLLDAVSLDDSFKAARITARAGETVEFRVFDSDPLRDDLIGAWSVEVSSLRLGDSVWEQPAGGVVKAICRVLPLGKIDFEELTR